MIALFPRWFSAKIRRAGFTLVEVVIAATLALLVVGAVMSVVVMAAKSVRKTQLLEQALRNTRDVQEHLTREISVAISNEPRPTNPSLQYIGLRGMVSDGSAPDPYFAELVYQVPVGNPVMVAGAVPIPKTSTSLVVACPPDVIPEAGDYVMLRSPSTGAELRVASVVDPAPGAQRDVTLNFAASIETAAIAAGTLRTKPITDAGGVTIGFDYEDVKPVSTYVALYRERKYAVIDAGAGVYQLQWWVNATDAGNVRILSSNIAPTQRYMFREVKEGTPEKVVALNWRFRYVGRDDASTVMGGRRDFWEVNQTEGQLRARSGDPLVTGKTDYFVPTTRSTTTIATTTTSSTTISTTTTSSTTKSTTIATTKSTTTKSTTTKATTVSTTSKSTTKVTTTSTTSKSTTKATTTSTTSKSTTKVTTTSTTSKSTTSTTTKSTTTTSTTSKSTTKATTTSTTSKSTTKATTTSTKSSTTTKATTIATTSTSTKSTTVPTTKSTTTSKATTVSTTTKSTTTVPTTTASTTKATTVPTTTIKQDAN